MPTPKNIRIPRQLGLAVMHSKRLRKCVEVLLYLHYYCDAGRYADTKAMHTEYAAKCRRDVQTYDTRIKELIRLKLAHRKDGMLYFASWDKIGEYFKIQIRRGGHYVQPPTGDARLEDILEAIGMNEYMEKCKQAFYYYINKYPEARETMQRVAGSSSRDAIHYSQLATFLRNYKGLNDEDRYWLHAHRADNNLSYAKWSKLFAYKSKGGMAYKKRKLEKLGLINIERKRTFVMEHHTTRQSRQWIMGTSYYASKDKTPAMQLVDAITFNSLNAANTVENQAA